MEKHSQLSSKNYKFKNKSQLSAFSDAQKKVWQENRVLLSTINTAKLSDGFIASVFDHSPKLLMTVGDLVKGTNSCQNYLTGGQIKRLMGYVLDTHTKVTASFHISPNQFGHIKDFNLITERINSGKGVNARFDGNRRIFTFNVEGKNIESKVIEYAYRRELIRAGHYGDNSPYMVHERAYIQDHRFKDIMADASKKILTNLLKDMNIKKLKKTRKTPQIIISGSIAPSGTYSDRGGGGKDKGKEFSINPY